MSISETKFLGATVTGFSTQANWNEQGSNCTVQLVEVTADQDDFILKEGGAQNYQGKLIGCPTSFQMGTFRFDGFIQGFRQENNFQGNPVFSVTLTNPGFILGGTQVIFSQYVGPVNDAIFNSQSNTASFAVSNVLNVFGYLEQGGANFGGSLADQSGSLLWEGPAGIRQAIEAMTLVNPPANSQVNWGGALKFRNHTFRIDFSAIPTAPDFFRIDNGAYTDILTMVTSVCKQAGVNYLVCLELANSGPHRIYFKIADLVNNQNLHRIGDFIRGLDDVTDASVGQELRDNDETQAILIGGNISVFQPIENWDVNDPNVVPFWGFDVDGQPITGIKPDGTFYADDDHQMNLNGSEIAQILGAVGLDPSYPSEILELRCAMADYDSWARYLIRYKENFARLLGIFGSVAESSEFEPFIIHDLVNDDIELAKELGNMNESEQWESISHRVWEYVKGQGEAYYGRKFLVKFPFRVQLKTVPGSTQVIYSDEPADAGFLPEGSSPLGLNVLNEAFFLSPDGRFFPFFRFPYKTEFGSVSALASGTTEPVYANTSNFDGVAQTDLNITNIFLYNRYEVDVSNPSSIDGENSAGPIIFVPTISGPVPAMVCTMNQPIFAKSPDPLGGIKDIAEICLMPTGSLLSMTDFPADSFPMKIHPPAFYPNGATVALQSNQYTYGPWGKFTADGRCNIEQDTTLTPWTCGGYDNMNAIALAKLSVINAATQVKEAGSVTRAGIPVASLGDILVDGGPTISNISASVGIGGITTTYTMETYTPRVGIFNRQNADRLRMFGQLAQQSRRATRQLYMKKQEKRAISDANNFGKLFGQSYAVRNETPHGAFGGHIIRDTGGFDIPVVYTQTLRESVSNVRANNDGKFQRSTCMSLDGLIRPISTNMTGDVPMGHLSQPEKMITDKTPNNASGLNPIRGETDFYWYSSGDSFDHLNARKAPNDVDNARLLALRGPALMTGWGYDIAGNPVPNAAASGNDPFDNYGEEFLSDHKKKSSEWPTGPVDFHWDKWRKLWTVPTIICGRASGGDPIPPGVTGRMIPMFMDGTEMDESVEVKNFFSGGDGVAISGKMICCYHPLDNKLVIISADCVQV